MRDELPQGWAEVEVGAVLNLVNGFAFKPFHWGKSGLPIIRIQNLNNPKAPFNYCDQPMPEKVKVRKGDLLFAWSGTPGTSFGAHVWNGGDAWLNQHIFRVEFNSCLFDKSFLKHAINQNLNHYISQAHGGAGLAHITKGTFEVSTINIAPFTEQRRIVAKFDQLLPKVQICQDRLEKISHILKRFRQSVLAAACSGRLTTDWREKHAPEDWQEVALSDVIKDKPKNGYSAKPIKYETRWRVLTLTATTSGKFDTRHFKYFDEPIAKDSPLWLQPDDILVQRGNTIEYVGVPAIYDGPPNEFIYPDLMMRLRANSRVITKFLYFALSWERTRQYLRDRATGTAGNMPKINQPVLMSVPINLPSIEEQQEIVYRVDALFDLADQIETRYQKAKSSVDKLTQSILAKTFRGDLVPQDPNDEPASVLLERIKMARNKKVLLNGKGRKRG